MGKIVSTSTAARAAAAALPLVVMLWSGAVPDAARAATSAQLRPLAVAPMSVSVTAGARLRVVDRVRNAGHRRARRSSVTLYLSRSGAARTRLGRRSVPALGPGANSRATTARRVPAGVTSGHYRVIACAAPAGSSAKGACIASRRPVEIDVGRAAPGGGGRSAEPAEVAPPADQPPTAPPAPATPRDSTAPVVTLEQPVSGSSTRSPTPTFEGSAGTAAGDSGAVAVDVYAGGSASGMPVMTLAAVRDANGHWSVAPAFGLEPGLYTASARQADAAGNVGTSASSTFTIDSVGPAVTLVHPDAAAIATGAPSFDGSAGTAAGDSATVTVNVYSGTSASGTPALTLHAGSSGGLWSTSSSTILADGTYSAQAEQSDGAGNVGRSAVRTFTVDTTKPSPSLAHPASGAFLPSATPTFDGSAGSMAGDLGALTVTIRSFRGALVQTLAATRGAGGAWSAAPASPLADGSYSVQVEQRDAAGNVGQSGARAFTVDSASPALALTLTPSAPDGTSGWYTSMPVVHVVADDANFAALSCKVDSSGSPVTATAGSAHSAEGDVPVTGEGSHAVTCTATDRAGNGTSATRSFEVDRTLPAVTISSPSANAVTANRTPTLSGSAAAGANDASTVTVKLYSGTGTTKSLLQTLPVTRTGTSWSAIPATPLPDGSYTLQAEQRDAAGNLGQSDARTFAVDATKPTIALALAPSAPNGAGGWYKTVPQVHVVADDANFDAVACRVDSAAATVTRSSSSNHSYEGDVSVNGDGSHVVSCTATDRAGNDATDSTSFKVDGAAPQVTIGSPAQGSTTSDQQPTFSGTAGSAADDGTSVAVKVYAGSSTSGTPVQTLNTRRDGSGSWSVQATAALPVGGYTAVASQSDSAGNSNSVTRSFSSPAVLLAAGDIASCTQDGDSETASLLAANPADRIAVLGDNVYENGTLDEFNQCYGPTWGAVKAKTEPALGNHEYSVSSSASGYFDYFGAAAGTPGQGWYSYDLGAWHVVVLNTSDGCGEVSCSADSRQVQWLQSDLAAHKNVCTLAYWHHPLFSSGGNTFAGSTPAVRPLWNALYAAGADVVINGHSHIYERFQPQDPSGAANGSGIREFIAGTGGYTEHELATNPAANSVVRNDDTFGVLQLVLRPTDYSWQFLPVAGKTFTDAGSASCH